jgi:hypothetical protein
MNLSFFRNLNNACPTLDRRRVGCRLSGLAGKVGWTRGVSLGHVAEERDQLVRPSACANLLKPLPCVPR